jgi:hypothetical protein
MPRLRQRILPEIADASSQLRQVINPPKQGPAKGERLGGRPKGGANHFSKYSQAVILEALETFGRDGRGKDGIIGFIHRALHEDVRHGVSLLLGITPKLLEANIIRKTEVSFQSVEDLDRDLAAHGLPPTREIFALDYHGDKNVNVLEVAPEATKDEK